MHLSEHHMFSVLKCSRVLCFVAACASPIWMLLHANAFFNVNFYLGQLNVSRSIILYLNSLEQRERERKRAMRSGSVDGWMDECLCPMTHSR